MKLNWYFPISKTFWAIEWYIEPPNGSKSPNLFGGSTKTNQKMYPNISKYIHAAPGLGRAWAGPALVFYISYFIFILYILCSLDEFKYVWIWFVFIFGRTPKDVRIQIRTSHPTRQLCIWMKNWKYPAQINPIPCRSAFSHPNDDTLISSFSRCETWPCSQTST